MQLGCLEDSRDGFEFASKVLYHISRLYSPLPNLCHIYLDYVVLRGFLLNLPSKGMLNMKPQS